MSKFSEWLKRNRIKADLNRELDRHKPALYDAVDRLTGQITTELRSGKRITLYRDYLLDKVRDVIREKIGDKPYLILPVEIALQAAEGALQVPSGASAEQLAVNVEREARRLKDRVRGARL